MTGKVISLLAGCFSCMAIAQAQSNTFPSSGNVGIGISDPQEKLEVNGAIKLGGAAEVKLTHSLDVSTLNPGVRALAASITGRKWGHFLIDIYANDTRDAFAVRVDGNGDGTLDNIPFVVNSLGRVGIGTVNPQAKLAVNGNILATEVKVKSDISVPDYVFDPDYELPSLSEIESYVKAHRHLPEVPSAADIERDGLNLAEMNLLLLKKVEELTLHLIEERKAREDLVEKVAALEVLVTK